MRGAARETAPERGRGLTDAEIAVAEQHRQRLLQRHLVAVRQIDANVAQRLQRHRLVSRSGEGLRFNAMRRAVEHRDHQLVHLVAVHVGDKALIDANDVDPLVAELIERIDVMPEAVDDQPAALLLQFAEKCPTLRGVLQYCGLIDAE